MTAEQRSRFEEIRQLVRESEARTEERFKRQKEEWERRFEWQASQIASLKVEVLRLQTRMMPPEAWRDFDQKTDRRKESA